MASACVNQIPLSPEKFLDGPWRRISKPAAKSSPAPASEISGDFEFRLEDPVNILAADELFSGGKLMPLHTSALRQETRSSPQPENDKTRRKVEIPNTDPYPFSPRAPRCSSRWKDLLGLKKLNINSNPKSNSGSKSLKMFLHRSSKSAGSNAESVLSLPLLSDSDYVTSGRFSLSSASSSSSGGYDHHDSVDLPRYSLDFDKFRTGSQNPPRVRLSRHRTVSSENPVPTRMSRKSLDFNNNNNNVKWISVDSPRMNASGRVIFQGLERSSSSPSSFNNGPRLKYKGMERSYSANVRVTPVLNVPVCSIIGSSKSSVFGFQMFPNNSQKSGSNRGHVSKARAEKQSV